MLPVESPPPVEVGALVPEEPEPAAAPEPAEEPPPEVEAPPPLSLDATLGLNNDSKGFLRDSLSTLLRSVEPAAELRSRRA